MRLKISTEFEPLVDIEVNDGKVQYHFVTDEMQTAVERWIE